MGAARLCCVDCFGWGNSGCCLLCVFCCLGAGWLSFFVCFEFAAVIVVWWIWWFGFVGGLMNCCGFGCMCFLVVVLD